MKNVLLFLLCFLSHSFLMAQESSTFQKSVYFETGEYALSETSQGSLQEIVNQLAVVSDYDIDILAYTDTDGSPTFNQQLSDNRAKAVKDFFISKGIFLAKTNSIGFGEEKSSNEQQDVSLKLKNRRVDIIVKTQVFSDLSSLFDSFQKRDEQVFKFKNHEENLFQAAKGSAIFVPSSAFIFKDGSEPSGDVELKIREIYDYSDMIMNDLHTFSNEKLLETGGMMYLEASSEGKELVLKKDRNLTISFRTDNKKNGMELFYNTAKGDNLNTWSQANQPASSRNIFKLKCFRMKSKELESIEIPVLPPLPKPELSVLKAPNKLILPSKPKNLVPDEPVKPDFLNQNYAELSRKERKEYDKIQQEYEAKLSSLKRIITQNQKRSIKYSIDSTLYYEKLPAHQEELAVYQVQVEKRVQIVKAYIYKLAQKDAVQDLAYSKSSFNNRCVNAETNFHNSAYQNRITGNIANIAYTITESLVAKAANKELSYSEKTYFSLEETNLFAFLSEDEKKYFNPSNVEVTAATPHITYDRLLRYYKESISEKTGLNTALNKMEKTRDSLLNHHVQKALQKSMEKTFASGKFNMAALEYYTFNVSQLGWINCDRFAQFPENEKMLVILNKKEQQKDEEVFITFKDRKSALKLNEKSLNQLISSGKIPINEPITLVGIKINNGKPYIAKAQTSANQAKYGLLVYQKVENVNELQQKLKSWD